MKWRTYKLEELCIKIQSGGTPSTQREDFYNGEIPWLKTKEVNFNRIQDTETKITEAGLSNSSAKMIPENSVIIALYGNGNTAGRCAINRIPLSTNQACCNLTFNHGLANPEFMFHLISSHYRDFVNLKNGGAQLNLNSQIIKEFEVKLPALPTQQKIASILSAYDDLIENNLKRIRLLEEAAQHLYREWFVQFRFPGWEEVRVVDGLPEGWEQLSFSAVAEFVNGFAFKPNHHSKNGLPIIKIKELKAGIGGDTPRYQGSEVPEKYKFGDNSILFSWSADLDVYWWANGEALLNQHLFLVHPSEGTNKFHFYFALKNSMEEFRNRATGATMKHIKRTELDTVFYTQPTKEVAEQFAEVAEPILNQVLNLTKQNQRLKEARDMLLPRLMSGALVT